MVELIEVVSCHLIGPKTWDRIVGIFGAHLDSPRTVWAACVGIYSINYVVVCMRPEMAMDFRFTKWSRCWMSGLPVDSPLALFWDCKNSPSLCEMDQKNVHVLCVGNCLK